MKILEIYKKKMSLIAFLLKIRNVQSTHLYIYRKLIPPQVFPLFVLKNFKIAGRASVVESHFSKVRETSTFSKSNTGVVCSEKWLF